MTIRINPGNLNKKIQIVEYIIAKDSDGFETKEEYLVLKTWAQVSNESGTEAQRSNSDFAQIKARFLFRTPPKTKITANMVIKFNGNVYDIAYINDYGYDRLYTEILADLVVK